MSSVPVDVTIPLDSGFTHILLNILAQGYTHIIVEYSGSGDSGAVDNMYAYKEGSVKMIEGNLTLTDYDGIPLVTPLRDKIEEFAIKHLLDNQTDWWNDEGGGGQLIICTADGEYHLEHYVNIVTRDYEISDGKFLDNGTSQTT